MCDREEPKCRYKLRCAHTGRWRGSMVILGPFDQHEVHLHHHDLANHNRLYVQSRGKRSFSFLPPDVFSHCDRSRHSVYKMHEPTTCRVHGQRRHAHGTRADGEGRTRVPRVSFRTCAGAGSTQRGARREAQACM